MKRSKEHMKLVRRWALSLCTLSFCTLGIPAAGFAADQPVAPDLTTQKTLYAVGYAHLDTQWRWLYPQVVNQFLSNTLKDNFPLLEKYPDYIFNFTGARRYMFMKEFFPEGYAKMKDYIAQGRWYPGGSSVDETDQNVPCAESVVRQILYGNQYFRREFNTAGADYMLPDCFGFPASLPTVLVHCGIKGFSTQKLSWGSAIGIPFNVGVWQGVDGEGVIAAFNPGAYDAKLTSNQSTDRAWLNRINKDGNASGVYADFRYYGTGDRGGAPDESSVQWMEKSVDASGPVKVISAKSDQMFKDITPAEKEKLPKYKGELLLTWHSTGSLSSQAYMKRWNRKNELLADAAERASVAAAWLGGTPYPVQKLYNAWILLLEAQMHDILPGDCLPKAYEYSWNDEILAMNQFAAVSQDATSSVAASLDTQAKGVPLVVYNPLSNNREDVVEATVKFPGVAPAGLNVIGPDGKSVPSQVVGHDGSALKILFLARVPSVSFSTFDVQPAAEAMDNKSSLKVTSNSVENSRYLVTLNGDGDVASVFDKTNEKQLITAPIRLGFLHENPSQFPAWNMDWEDRKLQPQEYVHGPAIIKIVENGPVRVALEVTRETRGSKFTQQIRLSAGSSGDRVEFPTHIDWRSTECSLEAVMPLGVTSPTATYDTQVGTMSRPNNNPKKYEVPQQKWFDVTDTSGKYGVSVLNDCKFGSDKPDDKTVRLTLLYTPGVRAGYQDEGSQDFGRHEMIYALQGHTGDWHHSGTSDQAARLNQPMQVFQSPPHAGPLGKSFSMIQVDNQRVAIQAVKKAEESDEIVVRVKETDGTPIENAHISFATPIISAREIDGQEFPVGSATVSDGKLLVSLGGYHLRAYAVKLAPSAVKSAAVVCSSVELPFNLNAVSRKGAAGNGSFDEGGRTYPGEQFPAEVVSEGIVFKLGPTIDGKNNALACKGQTLNIPAGTTRVYFLASADGDQAAQFKVGDSKTDLTIQNWTGAIGQWDTRLWKGTVSSLTYNWANRLDGLIPGFIKRDTVAWYADYRRSATQESEVYSYSYLFKYGLDVPTGATTLTLPDNDKVRLFAVTTATSAHDQLTAAHPLYDTLADHARDAGPRIAVASGSESPEQTYDDSIAVRLEPPLYWQEGYLHFTTDGSEPTLSSPVYTEPFLLSTKTIVKAKQFDKDGTGGAISEQIFNVNDTTPPRVKSANAIGLEHAVSVVFSKPLRRESAEIIANYAFEPPLKVLSATLSNDQLVVNLKIENLPTSMENAPQFKLTVKNVHDQSPAGNTIHPQATAVQLLIPVFELASYSGDGTNTSEHKQESVPTKQGVPWTINMFVKPDRKIPTQTVLGGFGTCTDDTDGLGRYICAFDGSLHYWSRNQDVNSDAKLDPGVWQMVSAVYDGKTVTLYKNSKPVGSGEVGLADDTSTVRITPRDPWSKESRFKGEIQSFSIWPIALSADALARIDESKPE